MKSTRTRPLTPKEEKFCQEYVKTGNKAVAYRSAYNCSKMQHLTVNRKAVEVSEKLHVIDRIRFLQDRLSKKNDITLETIVRDFISDRQLARETKQAAAAVKATTEIAKLHGLYEKHNKQLQPQIMQTILEVIFAELPGDIRGRVERRLTECLSPGGIIELPGPGEAEGA